MNSTKLAKKKRLLLLPDLRNTIGGPASFQSVLAKAFEARGVHLQYGPDASDLDALLLINGSRHLRSLVKLKLQGVRIVQRLGTPVNYTKYLSLSLKQHLNALLSLRYLAWLRRWFSDAIIYQSKIVSKEWDNYHGVLKRKPQFVLHNGVDTKLFNPQGEKYQSSYDVCLISVEGNQGADKHDIAIHLAAMLNAQGLKTELLMLGKPWGNILDRTKVHPFINFRGHVERDKIPFYLRGADVFISTDVIAGCPNSVLESLACGTPILGYTGGVLEELIEGDAGLCIPPEGDSWKGQNPGNIPAFCNGVQQILAQKIKFRTAARELAEKKFSIDAVADQYYKILFHDN